MGYWGCRKMRGSSSLYPFLPFSLVGYGARVREGGRQVRGLIVAGVAIYFRELGAARAWEWGQIVGEVGSDRLCLLREGLVFKIPAQVSVQGLPRLKAGSRMHWKTFDPEPLPPGWKAAPLGVCTISCFPFGGVLAVCHWGGAQLS